MIDLAKPTSKPISYGVGVSNAGNVVVGYRGDTDEPADRRAMMWTDTTGMVDLNDYLPTIGIDLTDWVLWEVRGVSGDGASIVGFGLWKGKIRGWLATDLPIEPPACYADCDGSGLLDIGDFICFQTFFAIGDPYADCDSDTVLTIDDFICFQTLHAVGC